MILKNSRQGSVDNLLIDIEFKLKEMHIEIIGVLALQISTL